MYSITTNTTSTTRRRAYRDDAPPACWCGQTLEPARPDHCRRCGAAGVAHSRLVPLSQAG